METIVCRDCGEEKPLTKFQRNRNGGHYPRCRKCPAPRPRVGWSKLGPGEKRQRASEAQRRALYKSKYKMTVEDYDARLDSQENQCACCHRDASEFDRWLAVDHDHECCPGEKSCGKCIRGLLCISCNRMLGFAADDPQRLINGAEYLLARKNALGDDPPDVSA